LSKGSIKRERDKNSEEKSIIETNEIFKILYVGPAINIKTIIIKNNLILRSASNFIPL